MVDSDANIQYIKNVGPQRAKLLNKLGVFITSDLLYHFPRRYEDRSNLKKAYQLVDGEVETIAGKVMGSQDIRPRKGLTITKVGIHDGTAMVYAVWFNQPYVKKQLPEGAELIVTGKVERKFGSVQIMVNDYEVDSQAGEAIHTARIVPVYPTTERLPQRVLRSVIKNVVDTFAERVEEFLPEFLLHKYRLPDIVSALKEIHFPESMDKAERARKRFAFEELFLLQLGVARIKNSFTQDVVGISHKPNGLLVREFLKILPFTLTKAQDKALSDIIMDMESDQPMNRLVQGDVGSGKTVVAAIALLKTIDSGFQGALMAPTEILAEQHYLGLQEILEPIGIKVALLTGSLSKKEKSALLSEIEDGSINLVVGTHALVQEVVVFHRLGLAVTDEQHRFGVKQRAVLQSKGTNPDVLVMTATPIPRTLALTVYGDLDISVIDELPPGRKPVKTTWVNAGQRKRVYNFIRQQVAEGRQVYLVCPLVEESEKLAVEAATQMAERLQTEVFPDLQIALLHGRMKSEEKERVMQGLRDKNVQILVSTTVIEVGVNIPNATVMVIEDADRFGLAQLHQLRGRVGRGEHQSHCILIANPKTDEGRARMDIMQKTGDGFVIAEEDLKLRGPGDFFGTRQSGLPDLKVADILHDIAILEAARKEAFAVIKNDPDLTKPEYQLLRQYLLEKFKGNWSYINIS